MALVQASSIPSVLAMEIQQFWTKPSMYNENHITHESKKRKQKRETKTKHPVRTDKIKETVCMICGAYWILPIPHYTSCPVTWGTCWDKWNILTNTIHMTIINAHIAILINEELCTAVKWKSLLICLWHMRTLMPEAGNSSTCNYLFLPEVPASGNKFLIYKHVGFFSIVSLSVLVASHEQSLFHPFIVNGFDRCSVVTLS